MSTITVYAKTAGDVPGEVSVSFYGSYMDSPSSSHIVTYSGPSPLTAVYTSVGSVAGGVNWDERVVILGGFGNPSAEFYVPGYAWIGNGHDTSAYPEEEIPDKIYESISWSYGPSLCWLRNSVSNLYQLCSCTWPLHSSHWMCQLVEDTSIMYIIGAVGHYHTFRGYPAYGGLNDLLVDGEERSDGSVWMVDGQSATASVPETYSGTSTVNEEVCNHFTGWVFCDGDLECLTTEPEDAFALTTDIAVAAQEKGNRVSSMWYGQYSKVGLIVAAQPQVMESSVVIPYSPEETMAGMYCTEDIDPSPVTLSESLWWDLNVDNILDAYPAVNLVAPNTVPGYKFVKWEVRLASEGGTLLDTILTRAVIVTPRNGMATTRWWAIAIYEEYFPALGIVQHFSGGILATDSGLTAGPDAGQHKIQRGTWSERFAVPDSADTIWANPYSTKSRTELIEGKTNVQTRFAESLDGDWQAAQEVEATYSCPYGIEALGFLYISAYKDGKQYLLRRQRSGEHTAMEAPLVIANSDEVAASLAFFPLQWALACAVQYNDDTKIYLSRDHGQSWSLKHTVAVLYPSLFCDDRLLWLVGYVDGVYGGAAGRVSVAAYRASSLALPESQALTIVGPSDAGRPAILRESGTWLVRTLAPRTTDWGDGEAAPSIVEYVSDNVGETWSKVGVHVV